MSDEILRVEVPEGWVLVKDDPVQLTDAGHYVSTYCLHAHRGDGVHEDCRKTCKTCGAPCRCTCHDSEVTDA